MKKAKKESRSQETGARRFLWSPFRGLFSIFFLLILSACSGSGVPSDTTTTQPLVMAALPNFAPTGSTITLQGIGFSLIFNENIVVVGNVSTQALSHQFIPNTPAGATEEITFTIPSNSQIGPGSIFAIVDDVISNTIPFTVESP